MIKKIISVILFATLAFSAFGCYAVDKKNSVSKVAENTYEDFFVKDNVMDINIDIAAEDLQDMYDNATNEEYHSADVTIDGVTVENVGIRTKGNMTLSSVANSNSDRYSFRIKFDKYTKDQTFFGLDELCLNNCYSDCTYMREYLHYEILQKLGMNVPEVSYCNVYINGELSGFYLAVEAIDDSFLSREFGDEYKDGNLYKMEMGSTLEYNEDENYSYAECKKGSDKELAKFKEFVKKLNQTTNGEKGDIEEFLNVDSALKYIASNTVLCNYDSYNGNKHHNFYLYCDDDGVFTVIPWDFNMSFGGFNGENSTVGIDTPFISGSSETLPLIGKLLSVDEYKERYYGYIKEIMSMLENFEERVNELKSIIKPYVEKDPTAFYSIEDFEKSTVMQSSAETKNEETEPKANQNEHGMEKGNFGEKNRDGGQPFGANISIVNCVADRLKNLNEQFNGSASKTTSAANGQTDRQPKENSIPPRNDKGGKPNDFQPPEMPQNDDRRPPDAKDFQDGQTPPEDGERHPDDKIGNADDMGKNDVIRVHVNGHIVSFDTEPITKNDTTLVGVRGIFEALGADVSWDEATGTVTAVKGDVTIKLTEDSNTALVNDEACTMSEDAIIENNSMMIPIRFVAEKLGMKVNWNEETKLITVLSAG